MNVEIKKSNRDSKKMMAVFIDPNGITKTVHFGSADHKDFPIYYQESPQIAQQKKEAYIARHRITEDWNDPQTAGSLAKHILWNKPTIEASIKDFKRKFNLR